MGVLLHLLLLFGLSNAFLPGRFDLGSPWTRSSRLLLNTFNAISGSLPKKSDFNLVNKFNRGFDMSPEKNKINAIIQGIPNLCPPPLRDPRRFRNSESVRFFFLSRKFPMSREIFSGSVRSAGVNPKAPLKVILHGWSNNHTTGFSATLREAYLSSGKDVNLIMADYSQLVPEYDYGVSSQSTRFIGERVSQLLASLFRAGISKPNRVHLIGFSLGAHIAGFAAKELQRGGWGRIGRITGLDPANPCFLNKGEAGRLGPGDATFVDVIHSNGYENGIGYRLGQVDFYPNGGRHQPGCGLIWSCHHRRAYEYFAESIVSRVGFRSMSCGSWTAYKGGGCGGREVLMGEYVDQRAFGDYYLWTNPVSPYARG